MYLFIKVVLQDWQTFSVKGQVVRILDIVGCTLLSSDAAAQKLL